MIKAFPVIFLLACIAVAVAGVPAASWRTSYADPCHQATIASLVSLIVLGVARFQGERGWAFERPFLAAFLALMPLVYVSSWFLGSHHSVALLALELFAVPVFGALAVLGLRGSRWWFVVGIAGHGIMWDAWHYGEISVVPGWYATGCLVVDVGVAVYVASRILSRRSRSR